MIFIVPGTFSSALMAWSVWMMTMGKLELSKATFWAMDCWVPKKDTTAQRNALKNDCFILLP